MKKKLMILFLVVVALVGIYFGGYYFYSNKFLMNVQLNSISLSNLTLAEAENKVTENILNKEIQIKEDNQDLTKIKISDLSPEVNVHQNLKEIFDKQDARYWPLAIFKSTKTKMDLHSVVSIQPQTLENVLDQQKINNDGRESSTINELGYSDTEGFYIEKGNNGNTINYLKLTESIITGITNNKQSVELSDNYETSDSITDMKALNQTLDNLKATSNLEIIYLIGGEEIELSKEQIKSWVYLDENNEPAVDTDAMRAYLTELSAETATYGKEREFKSTNQGTVIVPPGILGAEIDVESEIEPLSKDVLAGKPVKRAPAFIGIGTNLGEENEFGDTYVEVDLTYQMEYLYVNNEKILETPINSGKLVTPTVPGANAVIEMRSNTSLTGTNPITGEKYNAPVVYWMRFDNYAQGIHDASWAPGFGGDTYTWGGSLGCINTPLWAAEIIYQNVELGTPVVVFP